MRRVGRAVRAKVTVVVAVVMALAASPASADRPTELQAAVDRVNAEHRLVPGASAYVDGPLPGLPWKGASGTFTLVGPNRLSADDPYRIASITKPFTAAAVLRLAEDGRLGLDDSIARWLPAWIVDRVSVIDGVSYGRQITIRQLLNHTSGIYSHDENLLYNAQVAALPVKHWTAERQIQIAIRNGALFRPGQGWHYSDTGFVMLGLVLQRATGKSFAGALRELLPFQTLGMRATYHELLEARPAGAPPLAHQYVAALDFAWHDPSFDSWGGGGLVSTNRDLATFVRALFEGRVFRDPATLAAMLTTVPTGSPTMYAYGLGIGRRVYDGTDCWMHSGFWGSVMAYCPSLDVAFAGTTNQNTDEHNHTTHGILGEGLVHAVK